MIGNLSLDDFKETLRINVSPTAPIQSQEHLFGRKKQLEQVREALCSEGRSIFIYGDRGVGKTSLAQTIAFEHQSSAHEPILLACDGRTTFAGLMASALAKLWERKRASTTTYKFNAGYHGLGIGGERTKQESIVIPQIQATTELNEIVAALLEVGRSRKNEDTVVVIDEFDRIDDEGERTHFADFIKQVGDQRLPIRFVFCGVAESLQKLLGTHDSCYRYLEDVELKTLTYDARYEIIDNVARAFGVRIDDRPRYRIAAISDGFPHYIHRMCEKLLWQMFNDPLRCEAPTADQYKKAVALSVVSIEQHLKVTYEQAIMKDAPGYEQVLWAVADHSDFIRNTDAIYESYRRVMKYSDEDDQLLDRPTVVQRLSALKTRRCGAILTIGRGKKGWYQFHESIMRGYVRLRAEEQGCELALDYSAASSPSPSLSWRVPAARRGKWGTRPSDKKALEKVQGFRIDQTR